MPQISMVFAMVGLVLTQAGWMPPQTAEDSPPPPSEVSTCTPTGLFTASGDTVRLQRICIRIVRSPGQPPRQSLWQGTPLVITKKNGIYKLPFQNVHLIREGRDFDLVVTVGEKRVHIRLEANSDGVFSFEDAIDRLQEILE